MKLTNRKDIATVERNGITDASTIRFIEDVVSVYNSTYQGLPIYGAWLEARLAAMIQEWLPHCSVSYSQISDPNDYTIQSRTWDIAIHKEVTEAGYPPPATPGAYPGFPLVPKDKCSVVIDVKGEFNAGEMKKYAEQVAFNRMNNCSVRQLDFLGDSITPYIIVIGATGNIGNLKRLAEDLKLRLIILAKKLPKKKGFEEARKWELILEDDGEVPLQCFKRELLELC
jgi:hypothetical protein